MTRVSIYVYLTFTILDEIGCTRVCDFLDMNLCQIVFMLQFSLFFKMMLMNLKTFNIQSDFCRDPCSSSNVLDNERRDVTCTYKQDHLCDDLISSTWYRIEGSAVTTCPGTSSCGSLYPIWLNGTLPQVSGDTVTRTMCVSGSLSCCDHTYEIKIRLCPDFYAFCLPSVSSCPSRYCFNGNSCTSTTSHADVATSAGNYSTTNTFFESTTGSLMETSYVTRGNITESVEGSANSTTVKKKAEEGTSENDTWKFVAFGCIGVLVLAVLIFSIVFVIIRRRREKQTKPTKNDSIRGVMHFENEEHYDEIGNVPNSTLEGHTEKGNVYSTIDGDTNIASNQTSSNAFDGAVDESGKNQCYTNMLKQSAQNTRQTDTSDLKKKINFASRPSTDNGIERESKEYDDFEIDTNDSFDLKETNINSSGVEKENERSNNQYQTLQEHCLYEGMAEEHAYQHLKKDHQYESLSKGK